MLLSRVRVDAREDFDSYTNHLQAFRDFPQSFQALREKYSKRGHDTFFPQPPQLIAQTSSHTWHYTVRVNGGAFWQSTHNINQSTDVPSDSKIRTNCTPNSDVITTGRQWRQTTSASKQARVWIATMRYRTYLTTVRIRKTVDSILSPISPASTDVYSQFALAA